MAGFLIPAAIGAVGAFLGGKAKANQSNKQSTYAVDQARRDYEAQQLIEQEKDQRNLDGIDFLAAVAAGKGYNLPPAALEALKARGVFKGMPSSQRYLDAPKQGTGNVLLGALGGGLSAYGGMTGQAAMDRALNSNRALAGITGDELGGIGSAVGGASRAGLGSSAGAGDDDILSYYQGLLNLGGGPR